jgi:hypothetical protein
MDFFRLFAGSRRESLRNLIRLRARRERVLLSINVETALLLRDQPNPDVSRDELLRHLELVPDYGVSNLPQPGITH